jgi:hypothetical protein
MSDTTPKIVLRFQRITEHEAMMYQLHGEDETRRKKDWIDPTRTPLNRMLTDIEDAQDAVRARLTDSRSTTPFITAKTLLSDAPIRSATQARVGVAQG